MGPSASTEYRDVALEFTMRLAERDYHGAYELLDDDLQRMMTKDELAESFEEIVPTDWVFDGIEVMDQELDNWPGRQADDAGWAYVSIGGDVYSEGVTVIVTGSNGDLRIREIEFGRP